MRALFPTMDLSTLDEVPGTQSKQNGALMRRFAVVKVLFGTAVLWCSREG